MPRFKPTTIIALDSYAAAFCEAVCEQMEKNHPTHRRLLQSQAVVCQEGEKLSILSTDVASVADFCFDLEQSRGENSRIGAREARSLFTNEAQIQELQQSLIALLRTGRNQQTITTAQQEGIKVSKQHRVFLILSATNNATRGMVVEFAHLLRWLFAKLFPSEPHSIEAVILLPGLFLHSETTDYGCAYALLKELDSSQLAQSIPAFDNHWLIDSCNTQGIQLPSLADGLLSYADAFVGFLITEAEAVGMLIGARTVREKVSAYSTFGYGELIFPVESAIAQLSRTLAIDILNNAFLVPYNPRNAYRRLLITAKSFVLSDEFEQIFSALEQQQGKRIWKDFDPKVPLNMAEIQKYIDQVKQEYQTFRTRALLSYKNALESAKEDVQAQLLALLDAEVGKIADASPTGLQQALQWLEILTNSRIAFEGDVLGEVPKNLFSKQQESVSLLDSQLDTGVIIETNQSQKVLNFIQELRSQARSIEDEIALRGEGEKPLDLVAKLLDQQQNLETAYEEYSKVLEQELENARQLRKQAIAKTRDRLKQGVRYAENRLIYMSEKLNAASQVFASILHEQRPFLLRYLLLYPSLLTIIIISGFLFFDAIGDWGFWLIISLVLVGIWGIALVKQLLNFKSRSSWSQEVGGSIKRRCRSSANRLKQAYNEQLRLDYDLYLQRLRRDVYNYLINAANQKAEQLRYSLQELENLHRQLEESNAGLIPSGTATQRYLLSNEDIQTYYNLVVSDAKAEADIFTGSEVSRSQVWHMKPSQVHQKLANFTHLYFEKLKQLSIGDILLRDSELMPSHRGQLELQQFYAVTEPLLQLHKLDVDIASARSRDYTLWVGQKDQDTLLADYRKIHPEVTAQLAEDSYRIQLLTRCLGFPAYFIGSIEFYWDCYERTANIEPENRALPDLIPATYSTTGEIRTCLQQVLLAIALNLITRNANSVYYFQRQPLGTNRREIAEKFATEFTSQRLYEQLCQELDSVLLNGDQVYDQLQEFEQTSTDLESVEKEMLSSLFREYNPLN